MGLVAIGALCGLSFSRSVYLFRNQENKHFVKCLESPQREPHQARETQLEPLTYPGNEFRVIERRMLDQTEPEKLLESGHQGLLQR